MRSLEEERQKVNKSQEITTGSGTINSTYVSNAERNRYVKAGNVATYNFTVTCKGTWNNTTAFVSGLPKPAFNTRFVGVNTWTNKIMRFEISTTGNIYNAYSSETPSNGQVIEGSVTYITEE